MTGRAAGLATMISSAVETDLPAHNAAAARLGTILGGENAPMAPATGTANSWRIADPSAAEFGQQAPSDVVSSGATGVARNAVGLAKRGFPERWLFAELVPNAPNTG